jgi:hypothetical protein
MTYSEFTLPRLQRWFGLDIQEADHLFADALPLPARPWLQEALLDQAPLAGELNTEKARSELIVAPVLMEVRRHLGGRISLFSGVEFDVDKENGLAGVCDFLLSLSPLQLTIEAPIVAIVEAKRENITGGIAQCLAEMVAAQQFNREAKNPIPAIFGVVTTGNVWKFMRLDGMVATVDKSEYYIDDVDKILGILVWMTQPGSAQA